MKFAFFSHGISEKAGEELIKLIEKDPKETKVVYITTAANTYPPDPEWLVQTKNELSALFPNLEMFDLERAYIEKVDFENYFSDKDLIFLAEEIHSISFIG